MRVLAIGDAFIPAEMMRPGFAALEKLGHEVVVRQWRHPDIKALQADNLIIEQRGPEAVGLPPDLTADIGEYELLVVQFAPVAKDVVARGKKLRQIGVLRAGTENVDAAAARSAGIEIIATPGRNARAVAEFTVGMILAETRNIARGHAALKAGNFRKSFPNSDRIPELYRKKVGLIGLGHIGGLVAEFLRGFSCDILVFDPYLDKAPAGVRKVDDLAELLAEADIVSMHMRLTDETRHMIGAAELALMKPSAYLVNTARSGLIDEKALAAALENKQIMGAALDVFDNEPIPEGDPLLRLDNLTLSPHMAGSTYDAFSNTPALFCERYIKTRLA